MNATMNETCRAASRYDDLIALFPLRPIRSEEAYDRAAAVMDSLLGIDRNIDQEDYLDVLGDLIRAYDVEHRALPTLTQGTILRAIMEERGVNQAALSKGTGVADSNISAMLANRRGISRRNCELFGRFFNLSPSRFQVK